MASVKTFISKINEIEGVAGCLLVREDGTIIGQDVENYKELSSLLVFSGRCAKEIMDQVGFSFCEQISFGREGGDHFHLFPVHNYFLGIVQTSDCQVTEMKTKVNYLLSRVKQ